MACPLSRICPSLTSMRRNPTRKPISPPGLVRTASYSRGCSSDQGSAATLCSVLFPGPALAPAMPSSGTDSVAGPLASTLRMPAPWPAS